MIKRFINGLYIIATPIGNLEDITFRAVDTLKSVDFIICENPIYSLKLLNKLGIKKKLYSLHDYNENLLIKRIEKYQTNSSVALISDAGSPLISDPGYKLIQNYINKGIYVTSIPGPSSVISSLQLSGLPINNFQFFGFVPKNSASIKALAVNLKNITCTSVFFISGNRLLLFLQTLLLELVDRRVAVCKELTKKNEHIFRGNLKEIVKKINNKDINLKGEFTIIIDSKEKKSKVLITEITKNQIKKLLKKFTLTEVVEIVHNLTNISKKEIYKMALLIKNG